MTNGHPPPLSILKQKLPNYINEIKEKHSENAKAVAFTIFIRDVFGIESRDVDFEIPVKSAVLQLRGRIDAVFGNLILEFKKNLIQSLNEAEEELIKYFQSYHEKYPNSNYLGIANDGIHFKVFRPVIESKNVVGVEKIDEIDLEKSNVEQIFLWFDSYLFSSEKIIPTSADIRRRFGLESPTFLTIQKKLEILFEKAQIHKPTTIKYENWNRYLEIVYGDKPNQKELFFKHTYLSTLVKLIVHIKISKGKSSYNDEIVPILFGDTFTQAGIQNFMEEDFFTWILALPIRKQASEIFMNLLKEIKVYDFEKINEDVLKELYQELVSKDVRKLLGEFYTPDWLAQTMIEESLSNNPSRSVMDPACGSGTFLFKTIQFKIQTLSKRGMTQSEILEHILETVIGFDVHPLAIIIARTNYLLSLQEILHSRKGPISIPVYLSDSLKIPSQKIDLISGIDTFEFDALDKKFQFPTSIAKNLKKMDEIVETLRIFKIKIRFI